MADRKISDLTALTTPASGDYLPIVDISEAAAASKNKRITIEELMRGVPDGTAAAPGIAFETDPNTGIYSPGADQLAVSTGGAGRLFVDASGNVGVGATATAPFDVFATINSELRLTTASDGYLQIGQFANGAFIGTSSSDANDGVLRFGTNATERLRITSAGLVGIGTSAPGNTLHVNSGNIGLGKFSDQAAATRFVGITGTTGFEGVFTAGLGITTTVANQSQDVLLQSHNFGVGYNSLILKADGKVGIGTTSPATPLHVIGSTSLNATQSAICNSTTGSYITFQHNGTSVGDLGSGNQIFSGSTGDFGISSRAGSLTLGVNSVEKARIDTSGRLLVGTSTARANFFNTSGISPAVQIEGTDGNISRFLSVVFNSNDTNGPYYILGKTRSTTTGGNTVVASGDNLGTFSFQGSDGTELVQAAEISCAIDGTPGANDMPGRLVFSTTADGAASPTERMKITSTGRIIHTAVADNDVALSVTNNGTSGTQYGISVTTANDQNTNTRYFLQCLGSSTNRATITTDGGFQNYQANNVNLSDINTKKDISPAADTWNCLKEWEIVNYRYKDQPDDADLNLGVIAQQVAESCPEIITIFQEAKEATDDAPAQEERLGVKEQQMYWMAIKALQEAQARIEALEADVAQLKGE